MKLFNLIKNFRNDEDGAVTVDWVVLTAAIVGLGIAVLTAVEGGVESVTNEITTELSRDRVKTTFN
ncbi:hypothetical protein CLV78_102274 [Aliiruegeria haliotis]|uniref:Pilus assembly protein Flp/PilA n=1 Tax=Aliiruegeria haliotis TaxID=1280846 RepID=A0A2T0RVB8_9RHOB|nr:pilus assembly protein [Aliiruegeria haliotis]PRY25096.1 hypothetical protein CLV78_102273 [Aliiruegeria haliotis]PRY25097.1 hypothetical protein CLV78_102274 [Aliiruegeria haliotis]